MLYKDINKEVARQCCREHTVFNDKKHKESDCDHCPLRRDFKDVNGNIHRGICWFILMNGLTSSITDKSKIGERHTKLNADLLHGHWAVISRQ